MALLGYKPRFVDPLLSGQKTGTIRALRKYPIKPGERLYHYTGLRTKHCMKIGESLCKDVDSIMIDLDRSRIHVGVFSCLPPTITLSDIIVLNQFAINDGFASWEDMKAFWFETHGELRVPFIGIWIQHTPIEL